MGKAIWEIEVLNLWHMDERPGDGVRYTGVERFLLARVGAVDSDLWMISQAMPYNKGAGKSEAVCPIYLLVYSLDPHTRHGEPLLARRELNLSATTGL